MNELEPTEVLIPENEVALGIDYDRLIVLADNAEKRIEAIKKIKVLTLRITNENDWKDMGGKPYLEGSGAEKVACFFGVNWRIDEPTLETDEDGHFTYTYSGKFGLGGKEIECIGTRSSRSSFYSKKGGADVPPGEIDRSNVKKAAYTNCIANGVKRVLGIRNMTWDEIRQSGITPEKSGSIEYKKEMVCPNYGKEKGKPLSEASDDSLRYYLDGAKKTLSDPEKERIHSHNKKLIQAIEQELEGRMRDADPEESASFSPNENDDFEQWRDWMMTDDQRTTVMRKMMEKMHISGLDKMPEDKREPFRLSCMDMVKRLPKEHQ